MQWIILAAIVAIILVANSTRRATNAKSLGLRFVPLSSFQGIEWGTAEAEIVAKLGPPSMRKMENDVTSLYYPKEDLLGSSGMEVYNLYANRLIAGECISFWEGRRRDRAEQGFLDATQAIEKHYQFMRAAGHDPRGTIVGPKMMAWQMPYGSPHLLLFLQEATPEQAVVTLVVDDGRGDNEMKRLARFAQRQPAKR